MMPEQLVSAGAFCWNPACPDYAQPQRSHLRRFGRTKAGVQRYQCKTCHQTFTETKGTPFYGCKTPQATILECLALLADRISLRAIHRTKGIKEETVAAWLQKAATHAEAIEALLLAHHQVSRAQVDALWTFVGHKGEKGGGAKSPTAAPSGAGSSWRSTPAYALPAPSPKTKPAAPSI
jgi:transposase-like protein